MMLPRVRDLALPICLAGLVLCGSLGAFASQPAPDFSSWLEGAEGMKEAVRLHQEEGRPIFVYFYTDWCPYCRQFERELLASEPVEDYIGSLVAVRINPENGPVEAEISRLYGVRGFPMLFMLGTESGSWSMVERIELQDGRPVLKQPGSFVDTLKQASAR